MRAKEGLADYRYFPEPDLPPLVLNEEAVEEERRGMPELPEERRRRYHEELGVAMKDVLPIVDRREVGRGGGRERK